MTAELKKALATPTIIEAWKRNGSEIPNLYGVPFGTFVKSEVERWGKVVTEANIKPD